MADGVSPAKKSRLSSEENEQGIQEDQERKPISQETRNLKLDMSKYSTNIQNMTDEELVQIFDLGVKVKESFTLSFHEDSSFVKEELEKQMKPIRDEISKLPITVERNINDMRTSVADSLLENKSEMSEKVSALKVGVVEKVSQLSEKVLPVGKMEERIKSDIKDFKDDITDKIDSLAKEFQKPTTKGVVGENMVLSTLKGSYPNYTFQDVANVKGMRGDIRFETPEGRHFLIEVKNHKSIVQKSVIDRFKDDVLVSDQVKVGIMLSLKSGIAMKSKHGKFEFNHVDGKYLIYVPNALAQPEVMIWSVSLATELAGLNVEITDNQAYKLLQLCKSFQQEVKDIETCRGKIDTLKNAIKDLEESFEPIYKKIKGLPKKVKAILEDSDSDSNQKSYSLASTSASSQPQL